MLLVILIAAGLVAITVGIHAAGLGLVLSRLMKSHKRPPRQFWSITLLLVRVAWLLIVIHVAEITVWAVFYWANGCLPDAESAFYFSGVTYTTIGYGDVVLPKPWRMMGAIEGVTGILMCGLSAGLFFATVARIYAPRLGDQQG